MPRRPALFEYRDEFADFLPANGVPKASANYITWINRAVQRLGHIIGPANLSSESDVQALMQELHVIEQQNPGTPYIRNQFYENNQRSAFRKYAQMVQSNYRGLFENVPAAPAPVANDLDNTPARVKQTVYRKVRDTVMSRKIKRLYEFRCQVCGVRLVLEPGVFYAEAHHLQPLGGEHKGPDVNGNLICLCPNHHALFDFFAMPFNPAKLKFNRHTLGKSFVNYHNKRATK